VEVERTRIAEIPEPFVAPLRWPDVPQRPLFCDDVERIARAYAAELARADADRACLRALNRLIRSGAPASNLPPACGIATSDATAAAKAQP
jgi:hypothetical protein